jgi:hypothetical protein
MLERGFATETKPDASPVTDVDRAIEPSELDGALGTDR